MKAYEKDLLGLLSRFNSFRITLFEQGCMFFLRLCPHFGAVTEASKDPLRRKNHLNH